MPPPSGPTDVWQARKRWNPEKPQNRLKPGWTEPVGSMGKVWPPEGLSWGLKVGFGGLGEWLSVTSAGFQRECGSKAAPFRSFLGHEGKRVCGGLRGFADAGSEGFDFRGEAHGDWPLQGDRSSTTCMCPALQ